MSATTGTTTETTERQQNFMNPNQSPSHNMPSNNNKIGRPCKLTVQLLLACTLLLINCCTAVTNSSLQAVNESTGELLAIIS